MPHRNADVDFRPEKPVLETPAPPPKPSVRLLGSLKLPDGRPMIDPPTLRLDEFVSPPPPSSAPSSPSEREDMTLSSPETPHSKSELHGSHAHSTERNTVRMPFLLSQDSPVEGLPRFLESSEEETFSSRYSALFKENGFLKNFDSEEPRSEELSFSMHLPELPPLPEWTASQHSRGEKTEPKKPAYPLEIEAEPEEAATEIESAPSISSSFTPITFPEFQTPVNESPAPSLPESPLPRPPRELRPVRRSTGPVFRARHTSAPPQTVLPEPPAEKSAEPAPLIVSWPTSDTVTPRIPLRTGREMLYTENLHKSYTKGKLKIPVLKGVHFAIQPGEFVSIVGQSGSGKSTLLHLLGTLDNPDSGAIYFGDRRIDKLPVVQRDKLRNHSIGFVFQFYHLLPELTTLENVLSPLMVRESVFGYFKRRKAHTEKALEILERVGLSHRLKHRPKELSGGEMQRAAIARAIVSEPQILLADEPTGNLDAASAREIIELFQKISAETSLTIVMVTHDNLIAQVADRIVRMVDGIIV